MDWIPGISQIKSGVQLICGDTKGAEQTQQNFIRQCPGVSQVTSIVQLATGDTEGAAETQKQFFGTVSNVADGIPVVGHVKGTCLANKLTFKNNLGTVHYMVGDKKGGNRAMKSATRSTAVVGGGVGGFFVGGPVGAIGGGIAGGAAYDSTLTIATDKPTGYIGAIKNVVENPNPGDIFDTVMMPVCDGLAGYSAGQMAGRIANARTVNALETQRTIALEKADTAAFDNPTLTSGESLANYKVVNDLTQKIDVARAVKPELGPKASVAAKVGRAAETAAPGTAPITQGKSAADDKRKRSEAKRQQSRQSERQRTETRQSTTSREPAHITEEEVVQVRRRQAGHTTATGAAAKTATTATKGAKETDETQEKTATEDKQKNKQKKQQPKSSAETQNAGRRQSAASRQPTVPQNSSEHEQIIHHSSFASVYSETVASQMPWNSGLQNLQSGVKLNDLYRGLEHNLYRNFERFCELSPHLREMRDSFLPQHIVDLIHEVENARTTPALTNALHALEAALNAEDDPYADVRLHMQEQLLKILQSAMIPDNFVRDYGRLREYRRQLWRVPTPDGRTIDIITTVDQRNVRMPNAVMRNKWLEITEISFEQVKNDSTKSVAEAAESEEENDHMENSNWKNELGAGGKYHSKSGDDSCDVLSLQGDPDALAAIKATKDGLTKMFQKHEEPRNSRRDQSERSRPAVPEDRHGVKDEMMVGALDVTLQDGTRVRWTTVSGGVIYGRRTLHSDGGSTGISLEIKLPNGYEFRNLELSTSKEKTTKIRNLNNGELTEREYSKACVEQLLFMALQKLMEEMNAKKAIKWGFRVAPRFMAIFYKYRKPGSKTRNRSQSQTRAVVPCDQCKEMFECACGSEDTKSKKKKEEKKK